ncbi:hypothetical protein [Phytohabitans kaempferiae]|uniref:Major facilitator superfamily (MFS) profile domain-containing protein n=1 Tax=Phytohabitans kaempferiae TaxID=1620943 RepID=A0ABV6LW24_9ACTN
MRSRGLAVVGFLAIEAIGFTFQSLAVMLAWMAGEGDFGVATDNGAFGPSPSGFPVAFSESDLYAYGLVNLVIILVGIGLTVAVHAWRARRRARKNVVTVA